MRTRTFARFAAVGLATSMLIPAGASARPATDGPAIAAGGGSGVTVQDLRAYPDQVAPDTSSATTSSSSSSSDDGIDSGWFIGAGGLALASLTGLGVVYLIRVRTARQRAAA